MQPEVVKTTKATAQLWMNLVIALNNLPAQLAQRSEQKFNGPLWYRA